MLAIMLTCLLGAGAPPAAGAAPAALGAGALAPPGAGAFVLPATAALPSPRAIGGAVPSPDSIRPAGGVLQGTVRAEGSLEPIAGATVAVEGLGRAARTDASGYFVVADVPAGRCGIFSAIAPDAVSSVELRPGALAASAGDRLAGIVAVRTRDGGRDRTRAQGSIGLLSAHATVDGPLPGGRGSWILGGRRTYLDALTHGAKAVGLMRTTLPYGFYDGYLKATRDVGALGSLTLSAYADRERIYIPEDEWESWRNDLDMGWGSTAASLAYRQPIGARLLLEARAGYTGFGGHFDARHREMRGGLVCGETLCGPGPAVPDTSSIIHARSSVRDVLAATDATWYGAAHTLRGGLQLDAYRFRQHIDPIEEDVRELVPPVATAERLTTLAGYLEDEWRPLDRLELRGGLRVLEAGRLGTAWMPRLGARLRLAPSLSLTAGAGLYAQALRTLRDEESVFSSIVAYDLVATPPVAIGLARGRDAVLGAEWVTPHTNLRVDAYVRRTSRLALPPVPSDPTRAPVIVVDSVAPGAGSAHGVELMAHHEIGGAELTLAYALTFAHRRSGDERFPARWERRHTIDATAAFAWGDRGHVSLRGVLGSGQPYTATVGIARPYRYDPATGRWEPTDVQFLLGDHNGARLPGYFRLDVAARRDFVKHWFGRATTITPYLQVLNVLANKNALAARPDPFFARFKYWPQLPFLPTVGVEWRF